jgi:hypothetical protein
VYGGCLRPQWVRLGGTRTQRTCSQSGRSVRSPTRAAHRLNLTTTSILPRRRLCGLRCARRVPRRREPRRPVDAPGRRRGRARQRRPWRRQRGRGDRRGARRVVRRARVFVDGGAAEPRARAAERAAAPGYARLGDTLRRDARPGPGLRRGAQLAAFAATSAASQALAPRATGAGDGGRPCRAAGSRLDQPQALAANRESTRRCMAPRPPAPPSTRAPLGLASVSSGLGQAAFATAKPDPTLSSPADPSVAPPCAARTCQTPDVSAAFCVCGRGERSHEQRPDQGRHLAAVAPRAGRVLGAPWRVGWRADGGGRRGLTKRRTLVCCRPTACSCDGAFHAMWRRGKGWEWMSAEWEGRAR